MKLLEAFVFFFVLILTVIGGVGALVLGAHLATAGHVAVGLVCGVCGFAGSAALGATALEGLV